MRTYLNHLFLSLTLLGAVPSKAIALDYVTCESNSDNFRRCLIPRVRDPRAVSVWIQTKYSKSSCTEGYSWGVDDQGIWVKHGCRARFAVDSTGYRGPWNHDYDWDSHDRYDSYDHYNSSSPYDRHERTLEELRFERERLERERLELERLRLERERQELQRAADRCPPGARPGRCSDGDRRRGCKDWRTATGLGCRTE